MSNSRERSSSVGWIVLAVVLLLAAAASTLAVAELVAPGDDPLVALRAALASLEGSADGRVFWMAIPVVGPLVGLLLLVIVRPRAQGVATAPGADAPAADGAPQAARGRSRETGGQTAVEAVTPLPAPPSPAVGLRLLATLQEEARLIDFLREDIDEYSDEQVGAAVRAIHAALRKAIDERLTLEPILPGQDGDAVEVPAGFAPGLIRLTGNPVGGPPYKGILRHAGWRARDVRLPVPTTGSDPAILVPAEVEVG
jgi:Domain of unknown function (DUF2760)